MTIIRSVERRAGIYLIFFFGYQQGGKIGFRKKIIVAGAPY